MEQVRLVYISSAAVRLTKPELENLVWKASVRNRELDITGLLLHHEGCIIQVIEGPTQAVDTLMAKIERDPRHRGILVLLREPMTEREFDDRGMDCVDSSELNTEDRERLDAAIAEVETSGSSRAKSLLHSFAVNAR